MKLYLDTEYNDFGGELISMAMVSEQGHEFYEVLPCSEPVPWVANNVVPFLNKDPVSPGVFIERLRLFLGMFRETTIIANWPEDISHLCGCLITTPGRMMKVPAKMSFVLDHSVTSDGSMIPHNALEDARAMERNA